MQSIDNQTSASNIRHEDENHRPDIILIRSDVAGLVVLGIVVFGVLMAVVARLWVNEHSYGIKFFTEAMFSFLALIVIVGQLFIYRQQWHVMERQLSQARDHMVTIERPFVFLHAVNWQYHPDPARPGRYLYSVRPELRNSGNLPTVDMAVGIRYDFRNAVLPDGFEFPLDLDAKGLTIIPPGEDLRIATYILTDDQLIAIQKGTRYLYFWGEATYRDGFQGTPIHTTEFCQYVLGVGGDPTHPVLEGEKALQIPFAFYRTHNSGN